MRNEIIIDTLDGVDWFGEVLGEFGELRYRTGPRPDPDAAEYAARQWLRAQGERPQTALTIEARLEARP